VSAIVFDRHRFRRLMKPTENPALQKVRGP
jgi:hypothetical protein